MFVFEKHCGHNRPPPPCGGHSDLKINRVLSLCQDYNYIYTKFEVNRSNGRRVIAYTDGRTDGRTDGQTNKLNA